INATPFIVTEFIDGFTLRSWRESQALVSLDVAVTITLQLLDILKACHAQGCVHRDIKPDNIILEEGSPARVWLLDFGISYHDLVDIDFQTEHWQEVGNRFLRLPELSAGSYGYAKQDPRSDICFAAGILFYLLTGYHPDVLEDSEGRLPHQRRDAVEKLHRAASTRLSLLLAIFDEAFSNRVVDRFATTEAMREKIDRMMIQGQWGNSSADEDVAVLRDLFDTSANRRLALRIKALDGMLHEVQSALIQSGKLISDMLSITQAGWEVGADGGKGRWFWSTLGKTDPILWISCESIPVGEELLLRISGETVYRTDLAEPVYGDNFQSVVQVWMNTHLRMALCDPVPLPP
ncbi:MAG: hypothetical protein LBE50_04325, partial [Gallionellaceae bacterium]|nr:hypothetical protein [Gallionellaceae bacterium]